MTDNNLPNVSVIVVNYNGRRFLDACFNSLLAVDYPHELVEIIMVDNGSKDDSVQYVSDAFISVKVLKNEKNNYSHANNLGIRHSRGKYIVFINNDVVVERNWLMELVRCAEADPLIGAVGSKIIFKNGKVQSLGLTRYSNFYWGDIGFLVKDDGKLTASEELAAIGGCSVLYRRECLDEIGGFDEDFNMYLEDVDLSIRCRKNGWKLLLCPESVIHHEFHGTIGIEENARRRQEANRLLLVAKYWPDSLAEALQYNRGYFFTMPGVLRDERDKELAEALQRALAKVSKEHGEEKAEKIKKDISSLRQNTSLNKGISPMEELSLIERESLKKDEQINRLILALENMDAAKTVLGKELIHKNERITQLNRDLESKNGLLEDARRRIGPLEGELNCMYDSTGYRYFLKPIWKIIFSFKQGARSIPKFIKYLKELWHRSHGAADWREAYFKHLEYATFPPYPETVVLMVTKRCNLRCIFCDISNINEEIALEDAKKVIDNISRLRVNTLVLTGGEPFLHPQIFDIVEYAKSRGLEVDITTNGSLIAEYFDKIVDSRIDKLIVSLDGLGQVHDVLRSKPGLAEKVKDSVLKLKKLEPKGPVVSVSCIVTNKNIQELESVYDWAVKDKIWIEFLPVNFHPELHVNNKEQYEKLHEFIKRLRDKEGVSLEKYKYLLGTGSYFDTKKSLQVRCLALMRQFGIDVDGSIHVCCVWDFERGDLGNAIRDNLEELWHSPKYRQARQELYYHGCNAGCYNNSLYQFSEITGKNFIFSERQIIRHQCK